MSKNRFDHAVHDIDEVSIDLLSRVCDAAMGQNSTSPNPLFPNGDTWMIYSPWESQEQFDEEHPDAKPYESHRGGISFRNYCGKLELLVENADGGHIIYNKIDGLPKEDLLAEYMREITLVKHLLGQKKTITFKKEKRRMYQDNFDKWRIA